MNETTASMELVTHDGMYFTSYDSPATLGVKYRYSFHECLRGIMWWAVDLLKDPLDIMGEYKPSISPSISNAPSTETRHPTRHPTISPTVRCGSECPPGASGFFPTMDCKGYYECRGGALTGSVSICPDGLVYNTKHHGCDWKWNTECSCTSDIFPPTTQPSNNPVSPKPTSSMPTKKPSTGKPTQMQQQSSSANEPDNNNSDYYPV